MTILSPETISLVLCQWSIADMQVPPVPNQPKNAEILAQNTLKMQIEATIFVEIGLPVPEKKIFEGFLPYMGVAAILVM